MAYYDDEDKEQNNPSSPNVGETQDNGSQVISGQGATGAASQSSTPQQKASPAKAVINPAFTGVDQYINANKTQTQKLADSLSGYVNGLGQTARNSISNQQNQFNQAVDQNTVNLNQGLINQAKSNPIAVTGNQNDLQSFYKMRDAQYGGPNSFANSNYYDSAYNDVNAANEAAQSLGTASGQQTLLNQIDKRATPNRGAAAFDTVLLQTDPNAIQQLQSTRDQQKDLTDLLANASSAGNARAQQAAATTQATRAAVQDQFSGANNPITQLENSLNSEAQKQRDVAGQNAQGVLDALKRRSLLNEGSMQQLGITGNDLQKYKDLENQLEGYGNKDFYDLSKYANYNPGGIQISAQNVASPEDYARFAALNQLIGSNDSYLTNPSLSGKQSGSGLSFNYSKLISDMQGALAQKQAEEQKQQEAAAQAARIAEINKTVPPGSIPFGMGQGFSISDKKKKKDIKHFDAKGFLEKLSACK